MNRIKAGEGYRLLNVGEIIKENDEYYSYNSSRWVSIGGYSIELKVDMGHNPIRRKNNLIKTDIEQLIEKLEIGK